MVFHWIGREERLPPSELVIRLQRNNPLFHQKYKKELMSIKLSFQFTLKILPPFKIDLPPEVAKAHADGFTIG